MRGFSIGSWLLGWMLLFSLIALGGETAAQVSGGGARAAAAEVDAKSIKDLVDAAREQGYRVVLVQVHDQAG